MIAYAYDELTKEYKGEQKCQRDPLESEKAGKNIWLLPANSVWNKPLEPKEGFKVKFLEGAWQYQEAKQPEPSEDDIKYGVRQVRNMWLAETDKQMLEDYPITSEEKEKSKAYRAYLRAYTETENWWRKNPKTFEEWKEAQDAETAEL